MVLLLSLGGDWKCLLLNLHDMYPAKVEHSQLELDSRVG